MRYLVTLILFLVIGCGRTEVGSEVKVTGELVSKDHVYRFIGALSNGCTGIAVCGDVVLTAYHCVDSSEDIQGLKFCPGNQRAERGSSSCLPVASVKADVRRAPYLGSGRDGIAALRLSRDLQGSKYPIQSFETPEDHERLLLVAHGKVRGRSDYRQRVGLGRASGSVAWNQRNLDPFLSYRMDNSYASEPGDSGGPVFDSDGALAAIHLSGTSELGGFSSAALLGEFPTARHWAKTWCGQ